MPVLARASAPLPSSSTGMFASLACQAARLAQKKIHAMNAMLPSLSNLMAPALSNAPARVSFGTTMVKSARVNI